MNQKELLAQLDAAFKAITVTDMGDYLLVPEQLDRFIHSTQIRTRILPDARQVTMASPVQHLDRIGFGSRVLRSGGEISAGRQVHRDLTEGDVKKPTIEKVILTAREAVTFTGIYDTTLRRTIERGNFADTLVELLGQAAGRDIEEWGWFADEEISHAHDNLLSLLDGWIEMAGNKVYHDTSGNTFDDSDANWPESLLERMYTSLPEQFHDAPNEFRFYVPWSVENAYRDLLKARGTALGDKAQTEAGWIPYKGIPIVPVPMASRTPGATYDKVNRMPGRCALLTHPDNTIWGIFERITLEPDRIPKARRTDWVLTLEAAFGYEEPDGAVAAFLDRDESDDA